MKRALLVSILLSGVSSARQGAAGDHWIQLADRSELTGTIVGYEAPGTLLFRRTEGARPRRIPVEEVTRFQFEPSPALKASADAERARLFHGVRLTGRIGAFKDDVLVIHAASRTFRVRRGDLKSLSFGPLRGPLPELQTVKRDILIREAEVKVEGKEKPERRLQAVYGRLQSIGESVVFRVRKGKGGDEGEEDREFARADVRRVYLHHDETPAEVPPGWFAKVLFRNGDKIVGVLQAIGPERLRLFSHTFGRVDVEKPLVHSVAFVQDARMTVGNILLCEQRRIRELDRQGKELWTYATGINIPWSARKLENGNVLVANTNLNQILEIRPTGRAGGHIIWRLDGCQFPYDAVRLENGNTLVAEHYRNRVAEYEARTNRVVWQYAVRYPSSVQRLPNGNTFIATRQQVIEVDREGREQWRAALNGVRPLRAQRLENGNTLITDQSRHQVVEIDRKSKVVWRKGDLSRPVQAIRLEDGNTLILEQGNQRIIEIDPDDPRGIVRPIKVPHAQGMTIY